MLPTMLHDPHHLHQSLALPCVGRIGARGMCQARTSLVGVRGGEVPAARPGSSFKTRSDCVVRAMSCLVGCASFRHASAARCTRASSGKHREQPCPPRPEGQRERRENRQHRYKVKFTIILPAG